MTKNINTPNAIYRNADGTTELVELDSIDTVYKVIRELDETELDQIYAGEHPAYRVTARDIEVGDGDTFDRIEADATAALVALNQTTLDADGQPITVDHVRVQWGDRDETIAVVASEDSEPYNAAVRELVGDDRRIIWAQGL